MISLTFDDGWKNQYTRALPILQKYHFQATFYVITKMPEYMLSEGEGRMNPEDWKILARTGHEIGAHSRTHPHLQMKFPWGLKNEIAGSKHDIEEIGIPVSTFAYPYGRKNWFVVSQVRKAGFKGARLYDDKVNEMHAFDAFRLHCVNVYNTTTIEEIEKMINHNTDKWIIFGFHQIEPNPERWGITPKFFEKICELISKKNIPVKTVRDVLQSTL